MSEWAFIPTAASVVWFFAFREAVFSHIDHLPIAGEHSKPSLTCVLLRSSSLKAVKKSILCIVEKTGTVLGACDTCLSQLNQEEEWGKLLLRGRRIHVHSRGDDLVMESCQSPRLLSHTVKAQQRFHYHTGVLSFKVLLQGSKSRSFSLCSGSELRGCFLKVLGISHIGFGRTASLDWLFVYCFQRAAR